MMRRILVVVAIAALALPAFGAQAPQQPGKTPAAPSKALDAAPPLFTFVQVTDTHIIAGKPVTSVKKGIDDVNLLAPQPKFVVVTGDLINGEAPQESTKLYKELFSQLQCTFFSVYGNHDNREAYKKLLGTFNYAFDLPPYHFIALNNIERGAKDTYDGKFSEATIAWLKKHLQSVDKATPIILFCHATIYREPSYSKKLPGDAYNYEPVLELLKPYRVIAWFAGHAHCNDHIRKEGVDYFTTGSLSDNRGNSGCPPGYLIVTVYKDRVETAYRPITKFVVPIVVAQDGSGDFNGKDEKPINEAVRKASKTGGTVFIKPGEYLIRSRIGMANGVTIAGTPKTILRLPYPVVTTAAAEKGQDTLLVDNGSELAPGTVVHVYPPAGTKTFPDGDKKSLKTRIKAAEKGKIVLADPFPCAVPQSSRVGCHYNHVFCIHAKKNMVIKNLVMDGGRKKGIPMDGHCNRCGVLATGLSTYADGPTGPPTENLQVLNCHIRNFYGRAVASYSVVRLKVIGCLIEDIADEGIDFDHFSYYCEAIGNDVKNAGTGVTINDGSYCIIEHNRFTACRVGVTMWWWHMCPQPNLNVENKIRHNTILAPTRAAISIGKRCFRNVVTHNTVQGAIHVAEPGNVVKDNQTLK